MTRRVLPVFVCAFTLVASGEKKPAHPIRAVQPKLAAIFTSGGKPTAKTRSDALYMLDSIPTVQLDQLTRDADMTVPADQLVVGYMLNLELAREQNLRLPVLPRRGLAEDRGDVPTVPHGDLIRERYEACAGDLLKALHGDFIPPRIDSCEFASIDPQAALPLEMFDAAVDNPPLAAASTRLSKRFTNVVGGALDSVDEIVDTYDGALGEHVTLRRLQLADEYIATVGDRNLAIAAYSFAALRGRESEAFFDAAQRERRKGSPRHLDDTVAEIEDRAGADPAVVAATKAVALCDQAISAAIQAGELDADIPACAVPAQSKSAPKHAAGK